MMQSIPEGFALRTSGVIRAMSSLTEFGNKISIDGGVSVNPYFCQFLADCLGKSLAVKSFPEITAIGTAQLAGADVILVDRDETRTQRYTPSPVREDRVNKFSNAVAKSMHWRASS